MFRNHLIIILIHSLVFVVGCRNRTERQSNVKEVPNSLKSFEGVFEDEQPEDRELARDFVGIIQELGFSKEGMPYIVVDHGVLKEIRQTLKPKRYRFHATKDEILGIAPVGKGRELFFGNMGSRYLISMKIDSVDRNNGEIVAKLFRFDTNGAKSTGVFRKEEGEILRFRGLGNKEALANDISMKMAKIKAFMNKPKVGDDAKQAAHRLIELNKLKDDAERQYKDGQLDMVAGIATIFLAPLIVYAFYASILGFSGAFKTLKVRPYLMLFIFASLALIVLAININLIPGIRNYSEGSRKFTDLKTRLDERALYWGAQSESFK